MEVGLNSDRGRVREVNEDNYLFLDEDQFKLLAVADGMGGHQAGEVASTIAIETLAEYDFELKKPPQELRKLIKDINYKIYSAAQENAEYKGMGTTLTMGLCWQGKLYIGHVGDSRAYLLRNGELRQLTEDHSLVNRLLKAGEISVAEARDHPQNNVLLRALGTQAEVKVDLLEVDLESNDILLLCSDGLSEALSREQIKETLLKEADLQEKANQLVKLANQVGGYDNITVSILADLDC
ncbi:Stp1/IreP family PP2C-type Ser/Thr phosphatase [Fuchsiella alkaliacetigena]|uniref:Stp1/IreP family PP2C-type Ser/Thr phosphatase n=1 Tax=Fuchsiella alkaliacetigena TaxID=957042 RepID=UPI00200B89A1|nr:Stp1/IreP family PP2C-type Ser/Thr phosphatase [Fuchsiella alkaliacetigena]MCK8823614.1 Stp1/IreP family PP2C-type Ser/Thr phosphatase [Fuchsiella alkaliacetigena]